MYKKYPFVVEIELAGDVEIRYDISSTTESCLCYCEEVGNTIPWGYRYIREVNTLFFRKDIGLLALLGGGKRIPIHNENFSLRYLETATLRLLPCSKEGSFYT